MFAIEMYELFEPLQLPTELFSDEEILWQITFLKLLESPQFDQERKVHHNFRHFTNFEWRVALKCLQNYHRYPQYYDLDDYYLCRELRNGRYELSICQYKDGIFYFVCDFVPPTNWNPKQYPEPK